MRLILSVLLLITLTACASAGARLPAAGSATDGNPSFGLPAPSTIPVQRTAALSNDHQQEGSAFDTAFFTASGVQAHGTLGRFLPAWGNGGTLNGAAFALYQFNLFVGPGSNKLNLFWRTRPADGETWVGLANFTRDRWDWYNAADQVTIPSLTEITNPSFVALVVVLVTGTQPAELAGVRFGFATGDPFAALSLGQPAGARPLQTTLDATGSADADGTIAAVDWDLDGDGTYETAGGTDLTLDHSFDLPPGTYEAGVRITDNDTWTSTATARLEITAFPEPPAESFLELGQAGDDTRTRWLKSVYSTLPAWQDSDGPYQGQYFKDFADQVFTLTNAERAVDALPAYTRNVNLDLVAQAHSRHMALANFFNHVDFTYGTFPDERCEAVGAPWWAVGPENIAAAQQTPAEVMEQWMNSPSHHANIMHSDLEFIGIGVYWHMGVIYWTQVFMDLDGGDPASITWVLPEDVLP
jgi:uncharacterized protein YkwD